MDRFLQQGRFRWRRVALRRRRHRISTRFRHGEGQSRDRGTVEKHGGAGQRSETHNSRRQATRAFCGARDRDLQPQDQGSDAEKEVTGKYLVVWEKIGTDWKLPADIWNDG